MPKHVPIYRPIFKQALATSWKHRELWPIAAIAGLAGTGVVINDLLSQAKLLATLPTTNLRNALLNQQIISLSWDKVFHVSLSSITVSALLAVVVIGLIALIITASQQVMLRVAHTALKRKSHFSLKEIRQAFSHPSTWRFFALDVFTKLFISNLMISTSVLLIMLDVENSFADGVFGVIFMSAVLTLALSVNVLVMLALVGVTRHDLSLSNAIIYAWKMYKHNLVICLEMSVMLFAINLLVSTAYEGTLIIMGAPTVFTFVAALSTGSFLLYSIFAIAAAAIFVTVTLAFAGFATTFTYSSWANLAERLEKKPVTPRVIAHSKHFIKAWRT